MKKRTRRSKRRSTTQKLTDKLDFFSSPQKRKKATGSLRGYLKSTRRKMERGY